MAYSLVNSVHIFADSISNFGDVLEQGYTVVGLLALLIHIIVNFDVIFRKGSRSFPGGGFYLLFLIGVLFFHAADAFWGVFYNNKMANALIIDTSIYFIGMGFALLFWGMFITKYLGKESRFIKPIVYIGYAVFTLQMIALVVNFFVPILFEVTPECEYSAKTGRYVTLTLQIIMYLLIILYTGSVILKNKGSSKRRHIAILSFSTAMIIFLILQVFLPLLPMYSIGFLLGVTVLHTFVFEEQKVQRQKELEEARMQVELDALTGMKSKHAYVDREEQIDKLINKGEMTPFGIIVFDLNDLKIVNDTYGHEAGDLYIIAATKLIAKIFQHSEIYRIGGDEFIALLENEDYERRIELLEEFRKKIQLNIKARRGVIVSSGLAVFIPEQDNTFIQVFNRADEEMYQRKHEIKEGIGK